LSEKAPKKEDGEDEVLSNRSRSTTRNKFLYTRKEISDSKSNLQSYYKTSKENFHLDSMDFSETQNRVVRNKIEKKISDRNTTTNIASKSLESFRTTTKDKFIDNFENQTNFIHNRVDHTLARAKEKNKMLEKINSLNFGKYFKKERDSISQVEVYYLN